MYQGKFANKNKGGHTAERQQPETQRSMPQYQEEPQYQEYSAPRRPAPQQARRPMPQQNQRPIGGRCPSRQHL